MPGDRPARAAPFIVTAEMPADVASWADGLRRTHFPPERNWLRAHVTLFHAFAPSLREELHRLLGRVAREYPRPRAHIDGLLDLGGGTALRIRSPELTEIRERIADHFQGHLTAQDQPVPRLHITIQNKVTRTAAQDLQRQLGPTLPQLRFKFIGLGLHLYCNPHWAAQGQWNFRGNMRG